MSSLSRRELLRGMLGRTQDQPRIPNAAGTVETGISRRDMLKLMSGIIAGIMLVEGDSETLAQERGGLKKNGEGV